MDVEHLKVALESQSFPKPGLSVTSVRYFYPRSLVEIESKLSFYVGGNLYGILRGLRYSNKQELLDMCR